MRPLLVTHKWLYTEICNNRVSVFCCREPTDDPPDKELDSFMEGHIPSSRPLICSTGSYPQAPVPLISEFCEWIGSQCLFSTQSVVLYPAQSNSLHIFKLWWQLQYFQIRNVSILAGDLADWQAIGLPVERGLPPKKTGFNEANIRPDCFLYYSPRDLELFSTAIKSTSAYERKRFAFTQVVYVGSRDGPELQKFFKHLMSRIQEQIVDNKLEERKQLEHKKYLKQRKIERQLYYSIFDTDNLDPPRTLDHLRYLRTTSPPSSTTFNTTTEADHDGSPKIYTIPYILFLNIDGKPVFMSGLSSNDDVDDSRKILELTEKGSETNDNSTVTSEQTELDLGLKLNMRKKSIQGIFLEHHLNLNRPTLFIGDNINQASFVVFAAAQAYGGGIFQYAVTLLEEGLITKVNRFFDETTRNKLIRALDTRMTNFSRFSSQGTKVWFDKQSEADSKSHRSLTKRKNVDSYSMQSPNPKQSLSASSSAKHRALERLAGELLNLAPETRRTMAATPMNKAKSSKAAHTNIYILKYRQEDLDLIDKGLHPSGRPLTNTERFKLSLHLPLDTLENKLIDYSEPETVTMILDEHVNNVTSVHSRLTSTHSRGQMASRAISAKSIAAKFFDAYQRLERRRREHRIANYRFSHHYSTSEQPDITKINTIPQRADSTGSNLIHRILTASTVSPSRAKIKHRFVRTNTVQKASVGYHSFADQNFARNQSRNRSKKSAIHKTDNSTQQKNTPPSLYEIDDYFLLFAEKHICDTITTRDTITGDIPYSFELRQCFSAPTCIPSLASSFDDYPPCSSPSKALQGAVQTPMIQFFTKKYGPKCFRIKESYDIIRSNTMETTFKHIETKLIKSFRPRFVTLPSSPIDWLMKSVGIYHLNPTSIHDVALSIYLSSEEAIIEQASRIHEYDIGRTRHYWNVLCKAHARAQA